MNVRVLGKHNRFILGTYTQHTLYTYMCVEKSSLTYNNVHTSDEKLFNYIKGKMSLYMFLAKYYYVHRELPPL